MKKTLVLAIAVAFATLPAVSQANLLLNGSFQDGPGTTADFWVLENSARALTDADYVANASGVGSSPYGGRFLSFNAGDEASNGAASQAFATVLGQLYVVDLAFGNFGASIHQQLNISLLDINNNLIGTTAVFNDNSGSQDLSALWNTGSFTFVGTGGQLHLRLTDAGSGTGSSDLLVDNLSVNPVPEPFTTTLGVAAVGLFLRRRKLNAK